MIIKLLLFIYKFTKSQEDKKMLVRFLAIEIVKGKADFEKDVPPQLKPAVKDYLEGLGLGTDGKPLPDNI